jgi:hypothetical protein
MNLSELTNPYCIAGLAIFIIVIVISIYFAFVGEHFTIEIPVTKAMNDNKITEINNKLTELTTFMNNAHTGVTNNPYLNNASTHISSLQTMLTKKNIHIIEAYPYLPLYGFVFYDDANSGLNKHEFENMFELPDTNPVAGARITVGNILTSYIYMLVTYKNYVSPDFVNSSLISNYIQDEEYRTLYEADYIQFMDEIAKFKTDNPTQYDTLIKYIFNYNKNIGDYYDGLRIGLVYELINSYLGTIKTDTEDKYELSKRYTNLNYINDYLNELDAYIKYATPYIKESVNIFTITSATSSSTTA